MEMTRGLDSTNTAFVLDAIAHRAGWHERGQSHIVTGAIRGRRARPRWAPFRVRRAGVQRDRGRPWARRVPAGRRPGRGRAAAGPRRWHRTITVEGRHVFDGTAPAFPDEAPAAERRP